MKLKIKNKIEKQMEKHSLVWHLPQFWEFALWTVIKKLMWIKSI